MIGSDGILCLSLRLKLCQQGDVIMQRHTTVQGFLYPPLVSIQACDQQSRLRFLGMIRLLLEQ